MPQNLGLVGAEGAASATEFLTRLVAQRRAQEIQDRDYQLQQRKLAEETAARVQAAADLANYRTTSLSQEQQKIDIDKYRYMNAPPKQQIEHMVVPGTKDGQPGVFDRYVDIAAPGGKTIYESLRPPKTATEGNPSEFEGMVAQRNAELKAAGKPPMTSDDVLVFHNEYTRGQGTAQSIKEIADDIVDGTGPPDMRGMNRQMQTAVRAELARRPGFDYQQTLYDNAATQRWIATANGTNQVRLGQAIDAVKGGLDIVDELASKWKGGRFPILNAAELATAKQGVYGTDVASLARQLENQINLLSTEQAVVFRGGLSPTDETIKLAKEALGADWDEKTLHDMVNQARRNIEIRERSVKNVGPHLLDNRDNPYLKRMRENAAAAGNKQETPDPNAANYVPGGAEPQRPIISALAPGGLPPPPPGMMGGPGGVTSAPGLDLSAIPRGGMSSRTGAVPGANFNAASPSAASSVEEPISSSPLAGPGPSPNLNAAAPGAPSPNLNAASATRATDRKTISMRELQRAVDLLNQRLQPGEQPTTLREQLDAAVAKGYIITGVR